MVTSTEPKHSRASPQGTRCRFPGWRWRWCRGRSSNRAGLASSTRATSSSRSRCLTTYVRPWWRWTAPSWTVVCAAPASTVPSSRPVPASTICTGEPPWPRMSARSAARSRRVQCQAVARRRSRPAASSCGIRPAVAGPKSVEVGFGQRDFGCGRAQVRGEHVGVVRVQDGGLDGLVEERLGVVDEIGVQRVVAGDQDGEGSLPGAARPAGLLPQRGAGAGVAGDEHGVEAGDVHAQFERGGGGQAEQLAVVQRAFEGAALLGQVAAAVGGDPVRQRAVDLREPFLGDQGDQFGAAPGAYEGDGAHALDGEVGEQVGGLRGGGPADGRALFAVQFGQRRLPQREDQLAARRGVLRDLHHGQAGEPGGRLGRFRGGGGGEQEDRVRSRSGRRPGAAGG